MAQIPFTKEELGELTKSDLINLAKYFDIEYNKYMSKSKLIDLIDSVRDPDPVGVIGNVQDGTKYPEMSVRIRRIHEARLKGKDK